MSPLMKQTGCNTLGYGITMTKVRDGHRLGLDAVQIAKTYGLTYAAVRGGAYRAGLVLPSVKGRAGYGLVKELVCQESTSGLTILEICKKHGLKHSSVRSVNKGLGLGIPQSNTKRQ